MDGGPSNTITAHIKILLPTWETRWIKAFDLVLPYPTDSPIEIAKAIHDHYSDLDDNYNSLVVRIMPEREGEYEVETFGEHPGIWSLIV